MSDLVLITVLKVNSLIPDNGTPFAETIFDPQPYIRKTVELRSQPPLIGAREIQGNVYIEFRGEIIGVVELLNWRQSEESDLDRARIPVSLPNRSRMLDNWRYAWNFRNPKLLRRCFSVAGRSTQQFYRIEVPRSALVLVDQ